MPNPQNVTTEYCRGELQPMDGTCCLCQEEVWQYLLVCGLPTAKHKKKKNSE